MKFNYFLLDFDDKNINVKWYKKPIYKGLFYVLLLTLIVVLISPTVLFVAQDYTRNEQESIKAPYSYPPNIKYSYERSYSLNNSNLIYENKDIYSKIDQKYCKRDRCRFILPINIREQESKAQFHFRQISYLSGTVDRTIVLPNVFKSYLGSCLSNSFDYYYNNQWLEKNNKHFDYITMNDFKSWLSERQNADIKPTAQEIFINGLKKSSLSSKFQNCFYDAFNFQGRPIVRFFFKDSPHQNLTVATNIMTSILSDDAREHEYYVDGVNKVGHDSPPVDVIHLYYDRRYKIVSDKDIQQPMDYHSRWVDVSEKIASQLHTYVAIHWRMEQLGPIENLLPCAINLVKQIKNLNKTKHPNVFLLTDYPHLLNATGAEPESETFSPEELKLEHHQAIQYIYHHLNVSLTSVENHHIPYDQIPNKTWHVIPIDSPDSGQPHFIPDKGVLGIVDKLVAMKAQWFFAGKPGICAKSSSFTRRISTKRLQMFREGDARIITPLQIFGAKP